MRPEFDGTPFVAGSVIGLRAFAVDEYGRLTGVTRRVVPFTPGVNTAMCLRTSMFSGMLMPSHTEHTPGSKGCNCGFYAYLDGTNDYHDSTSTVQGIIEGYGTVTLGSRGFRAQKAELRALVKPSRVDGNLLWGDIESLYSEVPVFKRKREALEAFPLTERPSRPNPKTHKDFWTMDSLLDPARRTRLTEPQLPQPYSPPATYYRIPAGYNSIFDKAVLREAGEVATTSAEGEDET